MSQNPTREAFNYVREYRVLKLVGAVVLGLLAVPFGWPLLYSSNPQYDLIAFIAGLVFTGGGAFLSISAGVALIHQMLIDTASHR